MKTTIWTAALALLGAGAAFAQEDGPRREFERRLKDLEERFQGERRKLEKEFQDRLPPRGRADLERVVERLVERVEGLERRLNERFGTLPKDFDFKRFAPKFRELLPRFEDREFRFRFRGDKEEGKPKEKGKEKGF